VLSEIPGEWEKALTAWSAKNKEFRSGAGRDAVPDRLDEYFFYQSLLAVWPAVESPRRLEDITERLCAYVRKANKEAKRHTSWVRPNEVYEEAIERFIRGRLTGPQAEGFLTAVRPFAARIAYWGMLNSLSQVLLKMASPGTPDFYQGTELWDLTLVDPDNRRPIDYALRESYLAAMEPWFTKDARPYVRELLDAWPDGRIKMFITACGLHLRRRFPALFFDGDYTPLDIRGAKARHAVAWLRRLRGAAVLVVAPRMVTALAQPGVLPVGPAVWGDTAVVLPASTDTLYFRNVITQEAFELPAGTGETVLPIGTLLTVCPGGLWIGEKR